MLPWRLLNFGKANNFVLLNLLTVTVFKTCLDKNQGQKITLTASPVWRVQWWSKIIFLQPI